MGKYRYSIGLNEKYNFGTEIEFSNAKLTVLEDQFKNNNLPVKYVFNHKFMKPDYSMWYLDTDTTVSKYINGIFHGGELSSRILLDKKEYWTELKKICDILKNNDASINDVCSNHITVDLSNLRNDKKFFEVFSKLIALYEKELETFYMGDKYLNRKTKIDYASSISFALLCKINSINFEKEDFLYDLRFKGISVFCLRDAINLTFYEESNYKIGKTIEIRYPNGTINEKTIQNNINFTLKLINAIENDLFDCEKLTSIITKITDKRYFYDRMMADSNDHDFENIVKIIATSNEDIDDFMCQYEQVIKTKK